MRATATPLAVRSDGTVWTWGTNGSGRLGDGTTEDRPTPVQVTGLENITAVAAGASHSLALASDGTVWTWGWSWGWNASGQLGDGTVLDRSTPAQVSGLEDVASITAGPSHSVAANADGVAWTWGRNDSGQLGGGRSPNRRVPTLVPGF